MFNLTEKCGIKYLELTDFIDRGVKTFFTTRIGGVSSGNYASLNMGFHTGDDINKVSKNRKKFCRTVNINYRQLVAGEQIHGDRVYVVTSDDRGKGALSQKACIPGVDALITDNPGIPLISFYADCVPLYILDPVGGAVGLAHAGWKGTVNKIGIKTIKKMKEVYGTCVSDCLCAIGPAISGRNYRVDNRVISRFQNKFSKWSTSDLSHIITPADKGGQYYLDLKLTNYLLLTGAGIPESQIIVSNYCTFSDSELFYSYRQCNNTGRMFSIIEM